MFLQKTPARRVPVGVALNCDQSKSRLLVTGSRRTVTAVKSRLLPIFLDKAPERASIGTGLPSLDPQCNLVGNYQ